MGKDTEQLISSSFRNVVSRNDDGSSYANQLNFVFTIHEHNALRTMVSQLRSINNISKTLFFRKKIEKGVKKGVRSHLDLSLKTAIV